MCLLELENVLSVRPEGCQGYLVIARRWRTKGERHLLDLVTDFVFDDFVAITRGIMFDLRCGKRREAYSTSILNLLNQG